MLLPENTHFYEEDHVHHICISNNEKHLLSVTVDKLKVMSLDSKQPIIVEIDIPEEEAKEIIVEEEDDIEFAIDKTHDSLDSMDQLRVPPPFSAAKSGELSDKIKTED